MKKKKHNYNKWTSIYKEKSILLFLEDLSEWAQFRWAVNRAIHRLAHLCASTFAELTNGWGFGNLDPSTNWTVFGSTERHCPIRQRFAVWCAPVLRDRDRRGPLGSRAHGCWTLSTESISPKLFVEPENNKKIIFKYNANFFEFYGK